MGLELWYKGSVRRFNGYGMDYANIENNISLDKIGNKHQIGLEGCYIYVREVGSESVNFSVFYYDKETKYDLKINENVTYKYSGNAYGFELVFSLITK